MPFGGGHASGAPLPPGRPLGATPPKYTSSFGNLQLVAVGGGRGLGAGGLGLGGAGAGAGMGATPASPGAVRRGRAALSRVQRLESLASSATR